MRREIDLGGRLREMTVGVSKKLGLVEGLAKSGIFNAQLVDEGAAFLPAPVRLIGGCEGGIQELGTRFKGLHMTVKFERQDLHIRGGSGTHASRRSRKARWALRFCSARLLCARALPAFGVSPSSSEGDFGV